MIVQFFKKSLAVALAAGAAFVACACVGFVAGLCWAGLKIGFNLLGAL